MEVGDKITRYNELIDQFADVERKGKKTPYTSLNKKMFTFLTPEGDLGIRLAKDRIEKLISEGGLPMEQHGRFMKDFVRIPEEWWVDQQKIKSLVEESIEHTSRL